MEPQPGDTDIRLPITFDYKGGRNNKTKGKIIFGLADLVITIILCVGLATREGYAIWEHIFYPCAVFYVGLFLARFLVFNELWYSDVFETLKEKDYNLDIENIWQIFDIEYEYPYICYFRNGYKGIFVRMEKDAVTGKPDTDMFNHYDAIGLAYNRAHSLNMNIVHIDYMDTVGNDKRMTNLVEDLKFIENPDMHMMISMLYEHLIAEMRMNYASFDIYLYLTKDKKADFLYNVRQVCNKMVGGNFITYKILDKYEISRVCTALFNLHDFSIMDACDNVLQGNKHNGIRPLGVYHFDDDGNETYERINYTIAEEKAQAEERAKQMAQELENKKKNKGKKKQTPKKEEPDDTEEIEI